MSTYALEKPFSNLDLGRFASTMVQGILDILNYNELSDEDLFSHFKNGDNEAITCLLSRNIPKFSSIARSVIRDKQLAEDALQEALVLIVRKADSFMNQAKFSTWAYRIVYNSCIDCLRKESVRFTSDKTKELNQAADQVTSSFEDASIEQIAIQQTLDELSDEHSSVLRLVYVGGYSIEECAEILNLPKGTVKSRCDRAKKAFMSKYQDKQESHGTIGSGHTSKRAR